MMRDSLVAINLTHIDNKLLNNTTVPILFYWNGENTITETLINDESFVNYIKEKCMTMNDYTNSKLSYFFFKYDDNDEQYNENITNIQDIFPIDKSDSLMLEYLITIFKQMHDDFMKVKFENQIMFNTTDVIIEIYDIIQQKFPNRFVKESVINYVRSELKKKYQLNDINVNSVIAFLENIIQDKV